MSAISSRKKDPRVIRSRAAVVESAKTLFLQKGYTATSMEEIAALAGITKRTVYNNYRDKEELFTRVVGDVIAFAEQFVRELTAEFAAGIAPTDVPTALHDLGRRLALGIIRPEVIALRRLLISESPTFPKLATQYFERAPGRVLATLTSGFEQLGRAGQLRVPDPGRAAEQFAYLVAGEPLDRAMLTGAIPTEQHLVACADEGVETFLARYAPR